MFVGSHAMESTKRDRNTLAAHLQWHEAGPTQTKAAAAFNLHIKEQNTTQDEEDDCVCPSDNLRITGGK
jgi:hypothetical protein